MKVKIYQIDLDRGKERLFLPLSRVSIASQSDRHVKPVIDSRIYDLVYDGEMTDVTTLEELRRTFTGRNAPYMFSGRSLSTSDIAEVVDGIFCGTWYLDCDKFHQVEFDVNSAWHPDDENVLFTLAIE